MSIIDELSAELSDAMRSGDKLRLDALRQAKTEISIARAKSTNEGDPSDELCQSAIASYVKKMSKAVGEYLNAGDRGQSMAEKLKFEVEYLSRWLPKQMDESETRALVEGKISELGVAGDSKAKGRVIGAILKDHRDQVDGALVSRLVEQLLQG